MMRIAAALALTAAVPLTASAGRRASSGPVAHVSHGPFSHASPVAGGSGLHSLASHPTGSAGFAAHPRSLMGSTRATYASSRGISGNSQFSVSRWMFSRGGARAADAGSGTTPGSGSGGSTTASDPPPYGTFGTVPGALIRSEGLGFLYAPTGEEGRFHSVDGGDHIAMDENRAVRTSGTGTFIGARDTPPGTNPRASGGNSITPNSTISIDNATPVTVDNTSSGGAADLSGDIHDYGHGR